MRIMGYSLLSAMQDLYHNRSLVVVVVIVVVVVKAFKGHNALRVLTYHFGAGEASGAGVWGLCGLWVFGAFEA